MNWNQMKKNVGCRVQLEPVACRLDENSLELPGVEDIWVVEEVSATGIKIFNIRTHHGTTLGKDHVHRFTSNPDRSRTGIPHGFLVLTVQVFLQGNRLWIRPNARPGDPVKPATVEVIDKWVDFAYPADSSLLGKLQSAGYFVEWWPDAELSRKIDLEGWEVVVEPDGQGVLTKYRLRDRPDNQTLIKRKVR